MRRREFIASASALPLVTFAARASTEQMSTHWRVRGSEGFDALSFLSPLSGDPFYLRYYEEEVAAFAPRMPESAMEALLTLKSLADENRILLSPKLAQYFSGGADETIGSLLHSLDNAESVLRPELEAGGKWDAENWQLFLAVSPMLRTVLLGFLEAGFPELRRTHFDSKAEARLDPIRERLAGFDVVSEAEHFTGRQFDRSVEVVLLEFCKPHGVRVLGQRFLAAIDWPTETIMRTAAHELLHGVLDENGRAEAAVLAVLTQDQLLNRIVEEHDPSFGYNSLRSLLGEDIAQSIDQLIAERAGIARVPAERWTESDDGMHVLAAGFYRLMQQTGFAETGGDLDGWLCRAATSGLLASGSLHGAAAEVLGRPADNLWPLPNLGRI